MEFDSGSSWECCWDRWITKEKNWDLDLAESSVKAFPKAFHSGSNWECCWEGRIAMELNWVLDLVGSSKMGLLRVHYLGHCLEMQRGLAKVFHLEHLTADY